MIRDDSIKKFIVRKNNKLRTLYTYTSKGFALRKKHTVYTRFIERYFIQSKFSHAYTKKRSIYSNAKIHLENDIFIKLDIKNFFPTINHQHLTERMYVELNRKKKTITYSECKEIIDSSTIGKTGLPLGLVTSPLLSSVYMKDFDSVFYGKLLQFGLKDVRYTRYADDLFVSYKISRASMSHEDKTQIIIDACKEQLERRHLELNSKKTKIIDMTQSNHFRIAGISIVVGEDGRRKLSVGRRTIRDLYFDALRAYDNVDTGYESLRVKGMESFILSIEKRGYSHALSNGMKATITEKGYGSLSELIADL